MPSQVPRVNEPPAVEVVGGQGETVGASDLDDRGEGAPAAEGDGGAAGDGGGAPAAAGGSRASRQSRRRRGRLLAPVAPAVSGCRTGASDVDDRGEGAPAAEGDGGAAGDGRGAPAAAGGSRAAQ